jgi:predicted amidohydrolase
MLPVHVAVAQYANNAGNPVDDQDKAIHFADKAMYLSDLVILPEASFISDWTAEYIKTHSKPLNGTLTAMLAEVAIARNSYLCFSIPECDGDLRYNTAILIRPDGQIAGYHRKFHLSDKDIAMGFSHGYKPAVIHTNVGRIGIIVGDEAFNNSCIRPLIAGGVQLIACPSLVTVESGDKSDEERTRWEHRLKEIAISARCYVLWANKCGAINGKIAIGHSMIIDPHGRFIAVGSSDQEEIVRCAITPTDLFSSR